MMLFTRIFNKSVYTTRTFHRVVEKAKSFEERVKGSMIEKWIAYWKGLYIDYKGVVIDVKTETKEKPFKTFIIISGLAFAFFCARNNPDEVSYRDAILTSINNIGLVNPSMQRKESFEHVRFIENCYNGELVRRMNLGICSLIWIDNNSYLCNTYECSCSYLKLPLVDFKARVVDIGFLNKWWLLTEHMENYDVNY